MISADDAAESAKTLSLIVQTLLKVRESLAKKAGPDPELDEFIDVVTQAVVLQAEFARRSTDVAQGSLDNIDHLINLVENLTSEVEALSQEVVGLRGE